MLRWLQTKKTSVNDLFSHLTCCGPLDLRRPLDAVPRQVRDRANARTPGDPHLKLASSIGTDAGGTPHPQANLEHTSLWVQGINLGLEWRL